MDLNNMHTKERQRTNEGNPKLKQFSLVEERSKKNKRRNSIQTIINEI